MNKTARKKRKQVRRLIFAALLLLVIVLRYLRGMWLLIGIGLFCVLFLVAVFKNFSLTCPSCGTHMRIDKDYDQCPECKFLFRWRD